MTLLADRAAAPVAAATLRTLAGLEARRYARHPLFLVGTALLAWLMITISDQLAGGAGQDTNILPAFFLGVFGVFVGYHLTRSLDRTAEAIDAAPMSGVTRTAALCLACLVPGVVAVVWVGWMYAAMAVWPIPQSAAITAGDRASMLGAGLVQAVGGPLVGVLVGRWTRFPGAGLVAVVALIGWTILGSFGLAFGPMSGSRVANLVHLNPPFTAWVSSDAPNVRFWVAGGSPAWYLAYIALLGGLAAAAAMVHEAVGAQRSWLLRALGILAVLALACLALASAADPTRIPL